MAYTCIKPACTENCVDCNEAVPPGHFAVSRTNLDDLKRLRADGLASGAGSGRWIKAATAMMDAFPQIYDTAKSMNARHVAMRDAAADVVHAFEALGRTRDAAGLMLARSRCEAVMVKLGEALKSNHNAKEG